MQSQAATVAAYLAELPPERRQAIEAVRKVIRKNLDPQYEEGMQYGMIGYYVPHRIYPAGYHCDPKQPLPFAGLAAQKNYLAVYLMGCYGDSAHERWFRAAWAKTGKKLDMGKCCVRFKRLEDAALEVIGEAIARTPTQQFIASYEAAIGGRKPAAKKRVTQKAAASSSKSATTKARPVKAKSAKRVKKTTKSSRRQRGA